MCDTSVVLASASKTGETFFAKNSDREPNEAQGIYMFPAQDHKPGDMVQCTYLKIPQVRHTYKVLLSKPFWMWGAEMGANEHGVVIGNEAVFTKVPAKKEPGLIGMDYLRLALERSANAKQAVETITGLLEIYGQSGNCGLDHSLFYQNSFLITDGKEAYVLETIDKMWILKKVEDVYAISNALSITTEWDDISPTLIQYARSKGWCKNENDFNFAEAYSDFLFTTFSQGRLRREHAQCKLENGNGKVGLDFMKGLLRSHEMEPSRSFPERSLTAWNICMHASAGPIRNSQSVASMIVQYKDDEPIHWMTGTSAPCLSVFKPIWFSSGVPEIEPDLNGMYSESSFWWKHELVHRAVLNDFHQFQPLIAGEISEFEQAIDTRVSKVSSEDEKQSFTKEIFDEERSLYGSWLGDIERSGSKKLNPLHYAMYWRKNNQKVRIPL